MECGCRPRCSGCESLDYLKMKMGSISEPAKEFSPTMKEIILEDWPWTSSNPIIALNIERASLYRVGQDLEYADEVAAAAADRDQVIQLHRLVGKGHSFSTLLKSALELVVPEED
jgi:hypothetical protein